MFFIHYIIPQKPAISFCARYINDTSIVFKLNYGAVDFLFTGDAGVEIESKLIAEKVDLTAEVLKVGHHGSSTYSSEAFLKAVQPQYAIVEVGKDNSFRHPSLLILSRLRRIGAEIFRTDQDGEVRCVVKEWQVECERK